MCGKLGPRFMFIANSKENIPVPEGRRTPEIWNVSTITGATMVFGG